jgi:hypothetical protein
LISQCLLPSRRYTPRGRATGTCAVMLIESGMN